MNQTERILELEDLLTSARAIANRAGEGTAWKRFSQRPGDAGIGAVTPKTFRILKGDRREHPASLVDALNQNYFEGVDNDELIPFSYRTDGITESIYFIGCHLWDSENYNDYTAEDELVPLALTVRRLYRKLHAKLVAASPDLLFTDLEEPAVEPS